MKRTNPGKRILHPFFDSIDPQRTCLSRRIEPQTGVTPEDLASIQRVAAALDEFKRNFRLANTARAWPDEAFLTDPA